MATLCLLILCECCVTFIHWGLVRLVFVGEFVKQFFGHEVFLFLGAVCVTTAVYDSRGLFLRVL